MDGSMIEMRRVDAKEEREKQSGRAAWISNVSSLGCQTKEGFNCDAITGSSQDIRQGESPIDVVLCQAYKQTEPFGDF